MTMGSSITEVEATPALVIDLPPVECNLARLAAASRNLLIACAAVHPSTRAGGCRE
jgi:hypothetical protein